MKAIWNDPVGSKVIAGLILGGGSLLATASYKYVTQSRVSGEQLIDVIVNSSIEVNSFLLVSLTVFLISVILTVILVSRFKKYDIFLSAPMSFDTDEEYKQTRENCLKIIGLIQEYTPFKKIYYAGFDKETMDAFTAANHAAIDDLKALKKSKRFILYLPKKIVTSSIFEAGYAFRKSLPTIYFCHDDADLPFLMKDLNGCFRSVNKYSDKKIEKLENFIKQHGKKLFSRSM